MLREAYWTTIWGTVRGVSNGKALTGLTFVEEAEPTETSDEVLLSVYEWLNAYQSGDFHPISFLVEPEGTTFQQSVWNKVREIKPGETQSYAQIAEALGDSNASRAVGLANGKNPILLVVPCHRVIGASGALTGYAAGVERKRELLIHEQQNTGRVLF